MINSAFDNFVVSQSIAQYLYPRHLFCCVLVSKRWNSNFTPSLWRDIDLMWHIDAKSLFRHQQHIFSIATISRLSENITLPNLRHIIRGNLQEDHSIDTPDLEQALSLLSHTICLKTLFLTVCNDTENPFFDLPDYSSKFSIAIMRLPTTLRGLPNLRELNLRILSRTTLELVRDIIYNCRQCTVFHLSVSLKNQIHSTAYVEDFKASVRGIKDIRFKDIRFQMLHIETDIDVIVTLLEQSPLVESFYLFQPYTLETLQGISKILRDDSRRPLRYLGIQENKNHYLPTYWETMQDLFQAISGGYYSHPFSKKSNGTPTIHFTLSQRPSSPISPNLDEGYQIEKSILNNVPLYLSDTLTSLQVSISFGALTVLMSCLPSLQSLHAYVGSAKAYRFIDEPYNTP